MAYEGIRGFGDCVSAQERAQRLTVTLINAIVWFGLFIATLASMGGLLLIVGFGWLLNLLLSEYNVRRIQALGATVKPNQFPEVYQAAEQVCQRFGYGQVPRIIVVPSGEMNALAVKFARKKVVIILSELLAGAIEKPARLRFLIAHELCHHALDHGARGVFEVYKPGRYRQARELTCDNAGVVAAEDVLEARTVLKTLSVGRHLQARLDEQALIDEAREIYSGITGWFVRNYLTHPPAGTRLANANAFHEAHGGMPVASPVPALNAA